MKKVLILAYPFPPIPYSGTYRILRLCKGLDALGVEVHVLTVNIDPRVPNDFELMDRLPVGTQVHRTAIPDPWLRFQAWKGKKKREGHFSKGVTKIFNAFLRTITIPDHQIFWVPLAARRGAGIIRKFDISTVFVTAPPYSTLLCGSILKGLKGVKFIADLRDPIVGNIAQVDLLRPKGLYSRFMRKVHEKLESHVMKKADMVISNTKTHEKELREKYGQTEFVTVRNSFDPDDYQDRPQKTYEKFTIVHMGSIYGLRKADVLFKAIKQIEQRSANTRPDLQVLFAGSVNDGIKQSVDNYKVGCYVKFVGRVPHSKAIEMMLGANLLLIVKATGESSMGQIPAKFFEYIGTGNPVLCIGPLQSEVAVLIRDYNLGYVIDKDVGAMAEIIESLMAHQGSPAREHINPSALSPFANFSMAKKVDKIIRKEP